MSGLLHYAPGMAMGARRIAAASRPPVSQQSIPMPPPKPPPPAGPAAAAAVRAVAGAGPPMPGLSPSRRCVWCGGQARYGGITCAADCDGRPPAAGPADGKPPAGLPPMPSTGDAEVDAIAAARAARLAADGRCVRCGGRVSAGYAECRRCAREGGDSWAGRALDAAERWAGGS